jgi:capsid protein
VAQFFVKRMARQLRGWPLSYAIISLAKNDDRHTDATLSTAIAESMFVGFTDSDDPVSDRALLDNLADQTIKKKGVIASMLEQIGNVNKLGAGNMLNFKGGKMVTLDKKTPASTFTGFKDLMLSYVGMASGTPPEVIASKYSTSYTAHKGALNDFKQSFLKKREHFIDTICYPVLREIATNLILRGEISAPGFFESDRIQRAWLDGNWLGPSLGSINPAQEINAMVAAVKEGIMSRSQAAYEISSITDYEAFCSRWRNDEELYTGKTREERDAQALAIAGAQQAEKQAQPDEGKADDETPSEEAAPEKKKDEDEEDDE